MARKHIYSSESANQLIHSISPAPFIQTSHPPLPMLRAIHSVTIHTIFLRSPPPLSRFLLGTKHHVATDFSGFPFAILICTSITLRPKPDAQVGPLRSSHDAERPSRQIPHILNEGRPDNPHVFVLAAQACSYKLSAKKNESGDNP